MNEKMYKLAIKAINNLIEADEVEDDLYADALMVKQFMVDTAAQIPVPVPFNEGVVPVIHTTIEGAQKRSHAIAKWYKEQWVEGRWNPDLDYIAIFLEGVGDEMAAMTSAYSSLHDRYVQGIDDYTEWKGRLDALDVEVANHLADKIKMQKEIARHEAQAKIDKATIHAMESRMINLLSSRNGAHDNR